jgi:hypothetical protein
MAFDVKDYAGSKPTTIGTPRGEYTPTSDDLNAELGRAAKWAGLQGKFRVMIDGVEIPSAGSLPTDKFSALTQKVSVSAYDTAGC